MKTDRRNKAMHARLRRGAKIAFPAPRHTLQRTSQLPPQKQMSARVYSKMQRAHTPPASECDMTSASSHRNPAGVNKPNCREKKKKTQSNAISSALTESLGLTLLCPLSNNVQRIYFRCLVRGGRWLAALTVNHLISFPSAFLLTLPSKVGDFLASACP